MRSGAESELQLCSGETIFDTWQRRRLREGGPMDGVVTTSQAGDRAHGGEKRSGLGRERVRYPIRQMTQERLLVVDAR
jgi:hypothetical protein